MRCWLSCDEPSALLVAACIKDALAGARQGLRFERFSPGVTVVGFFEGVRSIARGRRRLSAAVDRARELRPNVAVLVGTPGFHVPLGGRLRRLGIPVVLVGPPQVWAWGGWRVRSVRESADLVICLLPFEEPLWRSVGVRAVFLGHPLADLATETADTPGGPARKEALLLLPGSRSQELAYHRPLFASVARDVSARRPGLGVVEVLFSGRNDLAGLRAETLARYGQMARARAALVVSGTATLELALLGVPQVACYHLSPLSRLAARLLVRTRYFSLPNILLGREEVTELLEPQPGALLVAVQSLLEDSGAAGRAHERAVRLRQVLGPPGAAGRIAEAVLEAGLRRGRQYA